MNIAVFLPNWLGDVAMATPALRAIRRRYPDARIVGIMKPYLNSLLSGNGWLDEHWPFNPNRRSPKRGHRAIIRRLRELDCDMAVLMPNSARSAVLAWLGGARERIGYARYGRSPLLTGKVYRPRRNGRPVDLPMVDYYLALAETAGCGPESRQLELATSEEDEASADGVWDRLGLRTDGRVVAMNSSGAYGGTKLWPPEHFAALARRVAGELDHDVLVFCGPGEQDVAREVAVRAEHQRVFTMADQPMDLGTAKACMGRTRLMVSTDSGPRHVAAAMGCPVITLFGPMLPIWSENPTQKAVHLMLDLDCIGCHKRVCPLKHHRCMRDLTPERVFSEVVKMIEEEDRAVRAA